MGRFKNLIIKKILIFGNFAFSKRKSIVIIDNFLPSLLSPWRTYEFGEILREIPNSILLADLRTFHQFSKGNSYEIAVQKLVEFNPIFKNKISIYRNLLFYNPSFVYLLFFENVRSYYYIFEKYNIDFFFTLYPGGGFQFNNVVIDSSLMEICCSKNFLGLIVNQNVTKEYLIDKKICEPDKIHFLPGVPTNFKLLRAQVLDEKNFNSSIRVLFFSNKYTPDGIDKGFPLFQKVAKKLLEIDMSLGFDVIGNFTSDDINDPILRSKFIFHGQLEESDFGDVLNSTHILLSPNQPFKLSVGSYDGFPLGTSVLAGFFRNVLVLTDFFNESEKIGFINGRDFVKIELDVKTIVIQILELMKDRSKMISISSAAHNKILDLYSWKNQISPRLNILKMFL
jgi:glycosyltransferase involved in cell wall biosynthesis